MYGTMGSFAILVVDDEPLLREFVQQILARAGHSVTCAEDGRQASEILTRRAFDLVVTDLLMPERDGIELIDELRRQYPTVRILAMSGGGRIGRDQYLRIARGFGAHGLLEKPFNHKQLLAAVDHALGAPSVS
jgi:CheY-like chemotaxis protein